VDCFLPPEEGSIDLIRADAMDYHERAPGGSFDLIHALELLDGRHDFAA